MNKIDLEIKELLEEKKKNKITFEVFDRRLQYLETQKEKQQDYINELWDQERENQISMSRGGL